MRNHSVKFFAGVGLLVVLILPAAAFAATQISAAIPGTNSNGSAASPGAFIANFYLFALMLGGILAFGAIVFGGVKYTASAGNPSAQSDAKEWIEGALIGLLLLAGAYLVLYVINPQLVNLNLPTLGGISTATNALPPPPPPTGANPAAPTPTGACPIPALPLPLTDPQAEAMENGQTIVWNSSDPAVQQNLNALQAAYSKFQSLMSSKGESYTLNSVYRPLQYQQLFYAIYQDAKTYGIYARQPTSNSYTSNPACSSIIATLEQEESKHGVCASTSPCLVGTPGTCGAPHTAGVGIDIQLSSGPVTYNNINALLQQNNIPLLWQKLSASDPVHFNLQNPPAGTCPS